jgi:hypothetical protein
VELKVIRVPDISWGMLYSINKIFHIPALPGQVFI